MCILFTATAAVLATGLRHMLDQKAQQGNMQQQGPSMQILGQGQGPPAEEKKAEEDLPQTIDQQ